MRQSREIEIIREGRDRDKEREIRDTRDIIIMKDRVPERM